jgi:predicted membrane channel-forming protein YqfA (hemolysin III family)
MTETMTEAPALAPATDDRSLQATKWLALFSGAALVADTVTIAIINRSFDPLDSILFLAGFVGMLLTAAALAVTASASRHGLARVALAVAVFLATALVLGVISLAFDQMGRHVFSAANKGLHGEWSFFSIGVALLALAGWADRRVRR